MMKRYMVILSVCLLSACSLFSGKGDPVCPVVGIMKGADRVALRAGGEAVIEGFKGSCTDKDGGAVLDLQVTFTAPTGAPNLPYFIAILGPHDQIVKRTAFVASFAGGKALGEHSLVVPEGNYRVVTGFLLRR